MAAGQPVGAISATWIARKNNRVYSLFIIFEKYNYSILE
jgi:hypothetical protein